GEPPSTSHLPARRRAPSTRAFRTGPPGISRRFTLFMLVRHWRTCSRPAGTTRAMVRAVTRSEEHTSELQSRFDLVCRLLLEKKNSRKIDVKDRIRTQGHR